MSGFTIVDVVFPGTLFVVPPTLPEFPVSPLLVFPELPIFPLLFDPFESSLPELCGRRELSR